jgi:CHAT domain-containing protein/Tfp pilus assembly protein PilF
MKRTILLLLAFCLISSIGKSNCYAQWRIRAVINLKQARELHRDAKSKEDLEEALKRCQEALEIFDRHHAMRGKSVALYQMGVINRKLGRYQESLESHRSAVNLKRTLGDTRGEAAALKGMGRAYSMLGRHREALKYFREALDLDGELGKDTVDGTDLLSVAAAYNKLGQHRRALEYSQRAVVIAKGLGNRKLEGLAQLNVGKIYLNMGHYHKSLRAYEKALAIARTEKSVMGEGVCLRHIASVYGITGEYDKALKYYETALSNSKKIGNVHLEGSIYNSVGQIYAQTGDFDKALSNFFQGLDVLTKIGASTRGVNHLIANLYMDAGELDKAEAYVEAADSNAATGRFNLLKTNYSKAEEAYGKILEFAQKTRNANALFTAYTGLGKAYEAQGDYEAAEEQYEKGMELTEEIRSGLLPSERVNFFRVKINGFYRLEPAKGLTRVRLKQNRAAESIFSSEVTRARAFADSISLRSDQHYSGVPKAVLEEENRIVTNSASLKKERSGTSQEQEPERYMYLSNEIEKTEKELKAFVDNLWLNCSPYAAVKYPRPVSLEDSAIRNAEHVIVYDVLDEGVGVRHLKGKEIVQTFFIRWNVTQLEKDVGRFRKPFDLVEFRAFDPELAHRLFKRLLSPVLTDVPEGTPIVIIPDGVLAILPFEALVMGGNARWERAAWGEYPIDLKYFGDAYPVSYYQSITALTLARRKERRNERGENLLVIADPVFQSTDKRAQSVVHSDGSTVQPRPEIAAGASDDPRANDAFRFERLPETAKMAENLRKLYRKKSVILTGLEAGKAHLISDVGPILNSFGWIVFATHGLVGSHIPGINEPFLVLTMVPPQVDGFLKMTDVLGLELNAELVALPACQTGLGIDLSGEGVMSMGRAFQYAGAESVLMSLWSVAERPTVQLVESFFRNLVHGSTKLQSLSLARKEIRSSGFDHPFFWAAFILVGEAQ